MANRATAIALLALVNAPVAANAEPPPPPAPLSWVKIAWQCPGRQRSSLEIEQLAQGSSGYQTKVVGLVISGRKINPTTVAGLNDIIARRNFLRPVGGYCEEIGELIGIEEMANGPKSGEAGWRSFHIPYALRR